MSKYKPLIHQLSEHFSMHPSRFETFVGMIFGLISEGNVQHNALSRQVKSTSKKAAVKRVERFFKDEPLSMKAYAQLVVKLLQHTGKLKLRLDRTNWKFGNKDVNYLVLSWQISSHMSLPLLFVELDKAGNSNTAERIDLIQIFIDIFGENSIAELAADREFVGNKWIRYLIKHQIPFFIRVKNNTQVPWGKKPCSIKDFLQNWDKGKPRLIEKNMFGDVVYFACKALRDNDPLIVMTNQALPAHKILEIYKERWSIESLFKNLKTAGFNWEKTHMTDPERLIKLLIIMGIAALFVHAIGIQQKVSFRKTVKCPLYSQFRSGLLQFQYYLSQSLALAVFWLLSSLALAPPMFQKSGG